MGRAVRCIGGGSGYHHGGRGTGRFTATASPPRRATGMDDFYDRLAPLYHLIFPDWDASIERLADQLAGIIRDRWGAGAESVLDVSCGIGTQSVGEARRGFKVTASDLSAGAVERARAEAERRGVGIDFSVCDMG